MTQQDLPELKFEDPEDPDLGAASPPLDLDNASLSRLNLGRVSPPPGDGRQAPPRLMILKRRIPVQTKLFAVFVLLVVVFAFGPLLLSKLLAVNSTARISGADTTPITGGGLPAQPSASSADPSASEASREIVSNSSLSGAGRNPRLVATAYGGNGPVLVTITSSSPAPLSILVSASPRGVVKFWRQIDAGATVDQSVLTGRWYRYCLVQPAADGFAATRGCGRLVTHQALNGALLPDGAAATTEFDFVQRQGAG